MAIASTSVWEIRSTATAANANGGFFNTAAAGTDYSQQNAAQYNLTGGTTAAASATIAHTSASADMVGNGMHIVSGTLATAGWYEIISVVVGTSITVDRNCSTGAASAMVMNIGGAMSLSTTTDASVFNSASAGNKFWMKNGTYTIGAATAITAAGTVTVPINLIGYNSTRGDNPTGSTRPVINTGAFLFTVGAAWNVSYIQYIGNAAICVTGGASDQFMYCKFTNNSTTAARAAISLAGANSLLTFSEIISYRGTALTGTNSSTAIISYCYIHDSDVGINNTSSASGTLSVIGCIIVSCVTAAIRFTAGAAGANSIIGCTLFGALNKLGTGVLCTTTGVGNLRLVNNIISGFVTGTSTVDATFVGGYDNFNDYFNNTTNNTNWPLGANDSTSDPQFTLVGQYTGTAGTTSGSVLTDTSANFANVTDNQDFCYIKSGTGITVGQYLITAHTTTTLTLDIAPGTNATADKAYQVTTGRNFGIGTNLKALGAPGVFPAVPTQGYPDIGAAQRAEPVSTDPGITNVKSGTNYTINNVPLTGTYTGGGAAGYSRSRVVNQ